MVLKEALSAISITLIVFCTKLLAKFDSSNLLSYMYFVSNYSLTISALFNARKFSSPPVKIVPSRQRRRYQLRIATISRGKKESKQQYFLSPESRKCVMDWENRVSNSNKSVGLLLQVQRMMRMKFNVWIFYNENFLVGHGWRQR